MSARQLLGEIIRPVDAIGPVSGDREAPARSQVSLTSVARGFRHRNRADLPDAWSELDLVILVWSSQESRTPRCIDLRRSRRDHFLQEQLLNLGRAVPVQDVTEAVRSPSVRGPGNRVAGIHHRSHDVAESSMARGRRSPRVSGPKVLVVAAIGSVARSVAVSPS